MDLGFIKLRVCEADLILVDDLEGSGARPGGARPDRDWARAALSLLDRRKGVGAQRLVAVSSSEGRVWLRVFGPAGAKSPAGADAALCAARWLLDSGRAGPGSLHLRFGLGEFVVDILDGSNLGLSLGPLADLATGLPLAREGAAERRALIEAGGERFEALPVALFRHPPRRDGGEKTPPLGPRAVAVFCEGGTKALRAKVGASQGERHPPEALPIRVPSRGELRLGASRDPGLDSSSRAALALGASVFLDHSDEEALVRSGGGLLWAELARDDSLYVAARPEYVFRGEFHVDDPEDTKTAS